MISAADSASRTSEEGSDSLVSSKRVVLDSCAGCARAVSERAVSRRSVGWDRYLHRKRIASGAGALARGRGRGAPNLPQVVRSTPTESSKPHELALTPNA